MAKTIKLNSKHLKVGDKIIRIAPLPDNASYTTTVVTVVEKQQHHIKVKYDGSQSFNILPLQKWDDGNWTRWKTKPD